MIETELKQVFLQALPSAVENAEREWQLIISKYQGSSRHYHTLNHLRDMYSEMLEYYGTTPPLASVLALIYHDFEYSSLCSDNEKQSANHAGKVLKQWNLPNGLIEKVREFILATQNHITGSDDEELKVFLDADMAILGYEPVVYAVYIANVRKEFSIYPDFIYNKGRRDFVAKTLASPRIFLSEYFYQKYEKQAHINLQNELNQLK